MEGYANSSHHSNASSSSFHRHQSKKRKIQAARMDTDPEDESETCSSLRTVTPTEDSSKKQNHSEIEKRRRDKMNTFITELSGLVPMCSAMSRKLDKLTVLRMAVQHMKTLRGSRIHSYTEGHYKPSFITDQELKNLILQSAEGFLFVVGCDRGRLLYVSESVYQVLKYTQTDLLGQSWFDILHPKDVAKVKEQLSSSDLAPRERLIDAKTMLPVKGNVPQKSNRLCPGARRSFFCRMKCKVPPQIKEETDNVNFCPRKKKSSSTERIYTVVHCTGYLKSWAKVGMDEGEGDADDACNLSCLVAIGRVLPTVTPLSGATKQRPVRFISRHTADGKFVFVDQKATLVLGFLPQELLGTSMYEYFHSDDISALAEAHKAALCSSESVSTPVYQFRTRSACYVKLVSTWKAFRNPWTRDTEYLLAKHSLEPCDASSESAARSETFPSQEFDFFSNGGGGGKDSSHFLKFDLGDVSALSESSLGGSSGGNRDIQRLISNQMEASKIGKLIADEIQDPNRKLGESSSSSNSPGDIELAVRAAANPALSPETPQFPSSTSSCGGLNDSQGDGTSNKEQPDAKPSALSLPLALPDDSTQSSRRTQDEEMAGYMVGDDLLGSSPQQAGSNDGNDEAAMAVIMSLLEADAGLGGPVDFTGLPWPLP